MFLTHLECTECRARREPGTLQTTCPTCGTPLEARYDLAAAADAVDRDALRTRAPGLWRLREVLPLPRGREPVTFGEGGTPLLDLPRLARRLGIADLSAKDESQNPTGSFKARGMTVAVTMAKELGARALAAPSAGNAGGALAAYGARAGLPVHIAMPADVPVACRVEAEICGAHVELIDGTIADCGRWIKERAAGSGWFDVSTLKEPYRVEGKKTMGYELAEQCSYQLPDVVLYPTGGGTGLVGMWKAFAEMKELGWLAQDATLPRMVSVQASGCAPVVEAFLAGRDQAEVPEAPHTVASGLRVPTPIGDRWMLRVLRASEGTAVAVDDADLLAGTRELAREEGLFAAPETGALVAALKRLIDEQWLSRDDRVVLFNTGTGLKYLECFSGDAPDQRADAQDASS